MNDRTTVTKTRNCKLRMLSFTDSIEETTWKDEYPTVFSGIGEMRTEVKILLRTDCTSFAQSVPRRVAAAKRQYLKSELARMVKLGVIGAIKIQQNWCAPCIIVPKDMAESGCASTLLKSTEQYAGSIIPCELLKRP